MMTFSEIMEIVDRVDLFGLHWLPAIQRCAPYLASFDTSRWIRDAAKRLLIFIHKDGRLTHAPARAVADAVGFEGDPGSKEKIAVWNAAVLDRFAREV